jgi:hypothetical protein
MRRWFPPCAALLLSVIAASCGTNPVRWSEPVAAAAAPGETELVVDSAGRASWRNPSEPSSWPELPGACKASLRARAGTSALYGVWWTTRSDSAATLYAGRSADGGASWAETIAVDSADASDAGCGRPAPSIAVVGDDVYVAYSMKATDGIGVFFAHSMDGGKMFHSPVAIVYGDRLVSVAVASDGQRVAVAYEEPNGAARSVSLALSRTQGHIFETRVPASANDANIVLPQVAIAGATIAVGWTMRPASGNGHAWRSVTRIGRMPD